MRKIFAMWPLIMTVGQVIIFPYYIIWLKEISITMTVFAWLFALHSFSAACGYSYYKYYSKFPMWLIYFVMAVIFISIYWIDEVRYALFIQLILGILQGYFRAWHIEQKAYSLHAVAQYISVGIAMILLSFIQIIAPFILLSLFGGICLLCVPVIAMNNTNKNSID